MWKDDLHIFETCQESPRIQARRGSRIGWGDARCENICTARSFDDGIARSGMENDACRVHDVLPNIA